LVTSGCRFRGGDFDILGERRLLGRRNPEHYPARRIAMTNATRITRIGTVIVPVSDQERALAFYVDTLGFEKRLDAPFGQGGRWIEVAPVGAVTTIALVQAPDRGAAGIVVSLATDDADIDHQALLARGVEADAEVLRMGEYVPPMFTFRDPDGNQFRMVERP
jgi:catechol 2,3-dioxygenase-like lactoylglutathione lyase family enzyme